MPYHIRKPTRISGFDYSSVNYYFVTICCHEKKCIFGSVNKLNVFGKIAKKDLQNIASHYGHIQVDSFVIMPNHVHAIISIEESEKRSKVSLSTVIGQYKSGVSRKIRQISQNTEVWQRSFHDHIIRNQNEYEKIWEYVTYNFQKWESDCFYPGKQDE